MSQPDFGAISIRWYCNRFIPGANNTTNNLSLVVIVQFGAFKIVFAGDLEVEGWRQLLCPTSDSISLAQICSSPRFTAANPVAAPNFSI
jgi:hypothetical protein